MERLLGHGLFCGFAAGANRYFTSLLALSIVWIGLVAPTAAQAACTYTGFGNNNAGQTDIPPGLSSVLLLTSGASATAALKKDGSIVVWGNDFSGLVSQAPTGGGFKDVALSNTHGLAVTASGDVVCWSTNSGNPCAGKPASFSDAATVAAGNNTSYVVRTNGTVVAWGSSPFNGPSLANGATGIKRIVATGTLAAGLKTDGYVVTWADGYATPGTLGKARTIAVSDMSFYAVTEAGLVVQWGDDGLEPMPLDVIDIIDINAAGGMVVALNAFGNIHVWGDAAALIPSPASITNVSMFAVGPSFLIREDCGGFCGQLGSLGCCDGNTIKYCVEGTPTSFDCDTQPQCGWETDVEAFDCAVQPNAPPNPKIRSWCVPNYACEPVCDGKACGDDGCGGACGTCGVDQVCEGTSGQCISAPPVDAGGGGDTGLDTSDISCTPDCFGKACGPDGCGGECGICPGGQSCDGAGQCVAAGLCSPDNVDCRACVCQADNFCCTSWDDICAGLCPACNTCSDTCVPACDGKSCGDDGCGGTCGSCQPGQTCDAGACVCAPDCTGKTCGDNGCGGSCGSCSNGQTCQSGTCVGCTPQCSGKSCGDDGCGGTCGSCGSGQTCSDTGTCVASCTYIGVGNNGVGQSTIPAGLSDVVYFTSGSSATAALKKDGSIVVWGNDFNGLVTGAPKGTGYKDVALSNTHGLAISATGSVVCWGTGAKNICSLPVGLSGAVSVAAGSSASYVVKANGEVVAWGSSNFDAVKLANGAKNIRRVVAAGQLAGGITNDGYAVTWSTGLSTPATLGKIRTLAVSHHAYFALKPTGEVVRWSLSTSDALPQNLTDVVDIAAADNTVVALTSGGKVRAWGASSGLMGNLSALTNVSMIGVGPGFLIRQECVGCGTTSVLGCCDGTSSKTCTGGVTSSAPCNSGKCAFSGTTNSFTCDAANQTAIQVKLRSWCDANPTCVGNCAGKSCGDDGCGNLCGTCGAGTTCNDATGQCLCVPQCSGKSCGSDGCGGSCGLCPSGTACESGTGQCKCVPKCDGKTCGSDGCGGSCGTCTATQSCTPTGACQEVCKPNCNGKTCGPDGCGGTCGSCGPATGPGVYFCHNASGTCRHFKCPNLPKDGCCDGEKAFYCGMFGVNVEKDCKAEGKYCGWEPKSASTTIEYSSYMCTSTPKSIGPVGKPRTCPGKPECVPSCSGKSCGSDGCGGSCGTCASNAACNFATGACTPTDCPPCKAGEFCNKSTLQCQKSACPDVPFEGCCKGNTLAFCGQSTGKVSFQTCKPATSTTPEACGWNGANFSCVATTNLKTTPANLVKECPASVCVPSCTGKTCGSDGCGGTCGSCASGETCQADGTCKKPCTPVCDRGGFTSYLGQGKYVEYTHCGYSDGCGGTCGCGAGKFCNIYGSSGNPGLCWDGEDECAKVGVGKKGCCAGDGQYKYCWSGKVISENCTSGPCTWFPLSGYNAKYSCSYSPGTATEDPSGQAPRLCGAGVQCTPKCSGRTCGPDGCGGSCGTCGAGQKCDDINGSCMTQCKDEVPFEGCCDGDVLKICGKQVYYDSDNKFSTTTCAAGTCGWSASGGKYACNTAGGTDPTGKVKRACKCVPQCSGKTCGPDGCGGTCGSCTSGQTCSQQTPTWQNNYVAAKCCTPQCSGKTCGPDGCGGTCGSCGAGKECDAGACVNLPPAPSCDNTKWQGSCNGNVLQFCSGNKIITQDCGASGQNWCGWNAGLQAYSCGTTGQADPSGLYPKAAAGTKVQCVPNCSGKQCGPDGCGGNCGVCNGDGGYCSNGKCTFQVGEPNYAYLYCPGKANQKVSAKTGQCTLDNQNKCKLASGTSFCGTSSDEWTCQCDTGCTARGDCCSDYSTFCASNTTPVGQTTCGDSSCNPSAGENCTTCSSDCGPCETPASNSPPWKSPLPEMLVLPGSSAQQAQNVATGLDSLLPAESPYPRAGLIGYMPREGVLYGPPLSRLFTGTIQSNGTSSSVAGAQGQAMRFGNGSNPTWGLHRMQFHDSAPGKGNSSYVGGLSVAMWFRIPKTAVDSTNGLATLRSMDNSATSGQQALCLAARPGDPNLEVKCPIEYPNIKPKINSVYAWYGVPGSSLPPGNSACEGLGAAKPGACQDSSIQALAETACIGKSDCVLTAPAAPTCATGSAVAPQLYVRATCSYGTEQFGNTLFVTNGPDYRLVFGRGPESSISSKDSVKDGQWHHVALTFRPFVGGGTTGVTTMYVDGVVQDSSTLPVVWPSQELVVGGARRFGIAGTTVSGEWAGAVAEIDEVFIYNRPISDNEVRQLQNKRDYGVLRQWPILSAPEVVATGAGLSANAAASTFAVTAERVNSRGSYTGTNTQGLPLEAPWKSLNLTAGTYAPAQTDADIANLTKWTVAGWVRPKLAIAGTELFRLTQGTNANIIVKRSADCGGNGVDVTFPNGTTMKPTKCAHGIATGKWSFVGIVQKSSGWLLYVDGSITSLLFGGTLPQLFAGSGAVKFEAGTGAEIGWLALMGRDLSQDDLEVMRNPGPVLWLDNGRYQSGGFTQIRDYANFHNRTGELTEDRPLFRNKQGLGVPSTVTQNSALLTLSSQSNDELFEVLIPARGRLAGLNEELVRPFGFSARIRVPAGNNTWDLIGHVKADWQNTNKWDGRVASQLTCNFQQFSNTLACSVQVRVREDDYYTYKYQSETRTVKSSLYPTEVDVAITWDGKAVRVAMGSPDVNFSSGLVASTTATTDAPKSSLLSMTRTGPVGIIGGFNALNRPAGEYFRLTPGYYEFGKTEYRFIKFYGRSLSNTELLQHVEANCDTLNCGDRNRWCLDANNNGGMAVCGECKPGSFESGGAAGTHCFVPRGWGEYCRNSAECKSNQCGSNNVCTSPTVNDECTAFCRQQGKACEQVGGGNWAYTQCASTCLPYYSPTDGYSASGGCTWTPTEEPGAVCVADDQCKSGGCSGVQDFVYNITVNRNPACKADGTCPGWYNTSDSNKPFKCNKKYGMQPGDADVCMWHPVGNTGIQSVKRCDSTSTQSCGEIHRQANVTQKKGPLGDTLYKCGECESGSYAGSDGVTRPLWVKRWRFLSPEACATMHANLVRAWVGGRYSDVPNFLYETPSAANLGQFILEKPRGSVLTPKEFSTLITKGVGPELVEYVLDEDTADKWNAAFPYFTLADCATDPGSPTKSPFTDSNTNYMICAPNQFPDGTQCPPPGVDAALADSFCQSGFCARDTGVCEEGYGRFEETDAASRRDDKESDDGSLGGMDFTQKNTTTLEFKKVKNPAKAKNDPQARTYSLSVSTSNTLKFFGATLDVMSIKNTMSGVLDGSKEAAFSANVVLFGISQPQSGGPPLKCPGMSWENGKLKKPSNNGNCELPTPGNHGVSLPTLKICTPAPGGCEDSDSNSPFNTVQKGSGPLCVKRFMFVGPVPISIEASVVIEACLGYGAGVDPETYEGSFEIRPEIGVALEVAGGVGGDIGILEVFAGVKAAITIVNLAFPIKWVLSVAQLSNDANEVVSNMWKLEYARVVTAELNVLKLSLAVVVEAAIAIFKAEWEFVVFEYEGLTFSWELSNDSLFSKKVDLQHKTANQ